MKPRSFSKVLIANRGEIACRLILACRALQLKSVAVYSQADAQARHVGLADEAISIGPGPANESYLCIPKLIDAAKQSQAEAIHPGYGFLSEQSRFAKAVLDADLVWIGPSAQVIELMGNKIAAKQAAEKAKVPTLAWALLKSGWTLKDLQNAAKKVGFPLLLKAAAGGGGRGMRLVSKDSELDEKAHSAAREAEGAFGSGEIFMESYCQSGRHIEVQVIGDYHGNIIALGERECSVQRRHQKVIEEAPAPNLSDKTRKALWSAATELCKSVGYVNAGTCEFLVDEHENFYFLEMNTRLQVEHPVTELVWGVDLPVLQLKIAAGERIPKDLQKSVSLSSPRGHAIEVRLYAEDPARNFVPSPGKITQFSIPQFPGIRLDSGYQEGDEIPIFYDPMIAKLIAWGMDRQQARIKLMEALKSTQVSGVKWNGSYLLDILAHSRFASGEVSTQFLEQEFKGWKAKAKETEPKKVSLQSNPAPSAQSLSPWVWYGAANSISLSRSTGGTDVSLQADLYDTTQRLSSHELIAEYPGKVLKVLAVPDQVVEKGQTVIVCESMKMEFAYSAPFVTKVKSVKVKEGELVQAGMVLMEWLLEMEKGVNKK